MDSIEIRTKTNFVPPAKGEASESEGEMGLIVNGVRPMASLSSGISGDLSEARFGRQLLEVTRFNTITIAAGPTPRIGWSLIPSTISHKICRI